MFVTRRAEAAEQLNCHPSRVYRGLRILAEWGQISLEANNQFTVVTVCNWTLYQSEGVGPRTTGEQRVNNGRTTVEQPSLLVEELEESEECARGARRPRAPRKKTRELPEGFAEFWAAYPRKVDKVKAVTEWTKLDPTPELRAAILAGLERHKRSEEWARDRGTYIPYPCRFLSRRRWEDEMGVQAVLTPGETDAERTARVLRQREEAARERGSVDPEAARAFREHLHGRNGDA